MGEQESQSGPMGPAQISVDMFNRAIATLAVTSAPWPEIEVTDESAPMLVTAAAEASEMNDRDPMHALVAAVNANTLMVGALAMAMMAANEVADQELGLHQQQFALMMKAAQQASGQRPTGLYTPNGGRP